MKLVVSGKIRGRHTLCLEWQNPSLGCTTGQVLVAQPCLCDSMGCSPPGQTEHKVCVSPNLPLLATRRACAVYKRHSPAWQPRPLSGHYLLSFSFLMPSFKIVKSKGIIYWKWMKYGYWWWFSHLPTCIPLLVTLWTVASQAPPSMGFPRQEYWSGLPFPSPGDLPNPGTEPMSPSLAGRFFSNWATRKAQYMVGIQKIFKPFPSLNCLKISVV